MDTKQILQAATDRFQLGALSSYEKLGGHANDNYAVTADIGRVVVKISREHSLEDLQTEVEYIDYLSDSDIPIPAYLAMADGQKVLALDRANVTVMEFVSGDKDVSRTEAIVSQVGSVQARLHSLPQPSLRVKHCWLLKDYLDNNIGLIRQHFPDKFLDFEAAYQLMQALPHHELPQSVIHGDIGPSNVVFANGKLAAVLDWEEVSRGPSLLDLADCILDFCFIEEEFQPELAHALLQAYEAIRPLSTLEKESLKLAVQYVGLVWSVWWLLQYGVYYPDSKLIDLYSDTYWKRKLAGIEI